MLSKRSSLHPRDEILGRTLISFDNNLDSTDTLSLKSCPSFRPSRTKRQETTSKSKPKYVSSSSLSDIREDNPVQSAFRKPKDPPDKSMNNEVNTVTENKWKRRTRDNALAAIQSLAKKQQAEEIIYGEVGRSISPKIGSETIVKACSNSVTKNGTKNTEGDGNHARKINSFDASISLKSQQLRDKTFLSSKSCTIFNGKRVPQTHPRNTLAKASENVHDDALEPAHDADTPALGVQELKRRFSVRSRTANAVDGREKKAISKLTQTSFTDAQSADIHSTSKCTADIHSQSARRAVELSQRGWNAGVTETETACAARVLGQEREENENPQMTRQANVTSSGSVIADYASISSEELRASLTAYFKQYRQSTGVSEAFSADIIPPPPEFNTESSQAYAYYPDSCEKPTNESNDQPQSTAKQEYQAENFEADNSKSKQRRPASAKASTRATRSRRTQTAPGWGPARRQSRRVTYSPSEVSGPSDRSEDQWSVPDGRVGDRGRRQLRRPRRSGRRRRAALEPVRWEEALTRSVCPRPISGRSSQAAGSRPVSGRSHAAAEHIRRPTLVEEVHRKTKNEKRSIGTKRGRSLRRVYKVPKNMPEAISRFLEQLSKDKEAIRVIHKMSLVATKR